MSTDSESTMEKVRILECPNELYHGFNVSVSNGYYNAVRYAHSLGCHSCQVFMRSRQTMSQFVSKMTDEDAKRAREYAKANDIKIVIHSPYTINFAHHPKSDTCNKMLTMMLDEFRCAEKLGAVGCIIHMGKPNTRDEEIPYEQAFKNKITNIQTLLKNVKIKGYTNTKLILETSCGAGSEMCSKVKDLAILYNSIKETYHSMIGFCIDTCHIFVAGYDIRKSKGVVKYLDKFDRFIGLDKVEIIHFNDSKTACGKHTDRHEFLGMGYIVSKDLGGSPYGLAEFARFGYLRRLPIILETPGYVEPQLKMIEMFSGFKEIPKI